MWRQSFCYTPLAAPYGATVQQIPSAEITFAKDGARLSLSIAPIAIVLEVSGECPVEPVEEDPDKSSEVHRRNAFLLERCEADFRDFS